MMVDSTQPHVDGRGLREHLGRLHHVSVMRVVDALGLCPVNSINQIRTVRRTGVAGKCVCRRWAVFSGSNATSIWISKTGVNLLSMAPP